MKNYRDNEMLRASFCQLAQKTFGINFENWYRQGFWTDRYIPYSVQDDDRIIANVSVNIMNMEWDGISRKLIQLGTVMTAPEYRKQGLSRRLMEEIFSDYKEEADGIYLFANESVLDFYPRFGFRHADEYRYSRKKTDHADGMTDAKDKAAVTMSRVRLETQEDLDRFCQIIRSYKQAGRLCMYDNPGLFMFYLGSFMSDCVYRIDGLDAFVIVEEDEDTLILHEVLAPEKPDRELVEQAVNALGCGFSRVCLGFAPDAAESFEGERYGGENLFVMGDVFNDFAEQGLMFPLLSHA